MGADRPARARAHRTRRARARRSAAARRHRRDHLDERRMVRARSRIRRQRPHRRLQRLRMEAGMAAVHARRVAVRGGREIGCALGALSDGAHRRPFGAPVECPAVQVERTPRAFAVARRLVRDAPLHRRGRTARPHLHDRHRGRRAPRSAPRRHGARERGVARVATPAERDEPRGRQHVSLPDVVSVDRARRRSRKPVAVQDERDRHAAIARRALRRIESAPSRRPGPGRADAGGSAQRRDSARMPAHAGDPAR